MPGLLPRQLTVTLHQILFSWLHSLPPFHVPAQHTQGRRSVRLLCSCKVRRAWHTPIWFYHLTQGLVCSYTFCVMIMLDKKKPHIQTRREEQAQPQLAPGSSSAVRGIGPKPAHASFARNLAVSPYMVRGHPPADEWQLLADGWQRGLAANRAGDCRLGHHTTTASRGRVTRHLKSFSAAS